MHFLHFVIIQIWRFAKNDTKTSQLWRKRDFSGKYNNFSFAQLLVHFNLESKAIIPIFERGLRDLLSLKNSSSQGFTSGTPFPSSTFSNLEGGGITNFSSVFFFRDKKNSEKNRRLRRALSFKLLKWNMFDIESK